MSTARMVALGMGLLAMLLSSACRRAPAVAAQPPAAVLGNGLAMVLSQAPATPVIGQNRLVVDLRNESGQQVLGATLGLIYDMPAMGSMPEMRGKAEVTAPSPGEYDLVYELPMEGEWQLTLSVEAPGHALATRTLKVSTSRGGFQDLAGSAQPAAGECKELEVSVGRQQLIGVTYATVEARALSLPVKAFGVIEVDERRLAEVTLKFDAYVKHVFVAETGKRVFAGTPLAQVYSPDLLSAEQELLQLSASGAPKELVLAAERRLQLWDVDPGQLRDLLRRGQADGLLSVRAPLGGAVLEKNVVTGAHVAAGVVLYRLGNLGRIWVEAQFYERDASWVSVGQAVSVVLTGLGGRVDAGRVAFVSPIVDPKTHTVSARIELPNPDLTLKPGMFADVRVDADLGRPLAVPDSALLRSGEHRYAFVARGPGRLQAVTVQVGVSTGDYDEVRGGLVAGDRVALGAAFLLSSEAQLREALPRWDAP